MRIDWDLHKLMLEMMGNTVLGRIFALVGNLSLRIRSFVEASSQHLSADLFKVVTEEHLAIVQALLDSNDEAVKASIAKHLHNAELRTLRQLEKLRMELT